MLRCRQFASAIGSGVCCLVATGTAVRDASLDITLSFARTVPELGVAAMPITGLGMFGLLLRRRG